MLRVDIKLSYWLLQLDSLAESTCDLQWPQVQGMRSALQFLVETYRDTAAHEMVVGLEKDLPDLDELLRVKYGYFGVGSRCPRVSRNPIGGGIRPIS